MSDSKAEAPHLQLRAGEGLRFLRVHSVALVTLRYDRTRHLAGGTLALGAGSGQLSVQASVRV